jgi:hypothetical protein
VGKSVGKNSRVSTILTLGIEHRTAVDPVPAAMGLAQRVLLQLCVLDFGLLQDGDVGPSLDLLDVDFLSVPAMIGVARDTALSIADKCHVSEITLDEECLGTQRQILILVLTEM